MLKVAVAGLLLLAVVWPASLLAADPLEWKSETEESALQFLEESRKTIGEMCRFDIEFFGSRLTPVWGTERRSHGRVYCDESIGYVMESRPIDKALLTTSRRTPDGKSYAVSNASSETWLLVGRVLTIVREGDRTYTTEEISRGGWLEGLIHAPYLYLPPWFDPTIDMSRLRSLYRIERTQATPSDIFIELVPREPTLPGALENDERLEARHRLWIDRNTHRPKKWWMETAMTKEEATILYKRFDGDPPPRELKVSLAGYREPGRVPLQASRPESPTQPGALEVTARVLWWLLF
jgi:hypothetical protein